MADETVNYRAKSTYVSKTFIANVLIGLVAILELTEVTSLIPTAYAQHVVAVVAVINIILRQYTVRPVSALLMPGQTAPMAVDKLK
jgi:hypothetical protein